MNPQRVRKGTATTKTIKYKIQSKQVEENKRAGRTIKTPNNLIKSPQSS